MDKFWEWMKEKEYTGTDAWLRKECADKQMLIGYMIEYLCETKTYHGIFPYVYRGIDKLHDFLKEQVGNGGE